MLACHLGNIAFRVGRQVRWDPVRAEIVDDPEAQRLVTRDYRLPNFRDVVCPTQGAMAQNLCYLDRRDEARRYAADLLLGKLPTREIIDLKLVEWLACPR